ncbi:nucleoid-associated protein [Vibrio breoganii]
MTSVKVTGIIAHQLSKDEYSGELAMRVREEALDEWCPKTVDLVVRLHRTFNTKPSKFGEFKSDSEFKELLTRVRAGESGFPAFSIEVSRRLVAELSKYAFADAGVLVFAQYRFLATEYLMIALIPQSDSLKMGEDLGIQSTDYLDMERITVATCIDLSMLESTGSHPRGVRYTKGRSGRAVSDFFLDTLGAYPGLNVQNQNLMLVQAVSDFVAEGSLDETESNEVYRDVHRYCKEMAGEQGDVSLSGLNDAAEGLGQYIQANGYDIEPEFPVDANVMRKLTQFKGKVRGMSIVFNKELLNERVFYDVETDTLSIKGVPPSLRNELVREIG